MLKLIYEEVGFNNGDSFKMLMREPTKTLRALAISKGTFS